MNTLGYMWKYGKVEILALFVLMIGMFVNYIIGNYMLGVEISLLGGGLYLGKHLYLTFGKESVKNESN